MLSAPNVADLASLDGSSSFPLRSGGIGIMRRAIDVDIAAALDALPIDQIPTMRLVAAAGVVHQTVEPALNRLHFAPAWLAAWLASDIQFLARIMQEQSGADQLVVRLERVDDNACRLFHSDNVRYRLVTTYRGPGTEWIPSRLLTRRGDDDVFDPRDVQSLERGWIAILPGRRASFTDQEEILHRSPAIEGSGIARFFLAIDDAADHQNWTDTELSSFQVRVPHHG